MGPIAEKSGQLKSLPRLSLRDSAVIEIRNAITMGTLKPGQHLVETQLSDQLGISRGTLREAMRQLQQEGLVVQDGRGRTHVPELTPRLISETFRVRHALEVMAAIDIGAQPDRDDAIKSLESRLADLADSASGALTDAVDADMALHREMCLATGNEVLLSHWESLAAIIRMSILQAGPNQARANMAAHRHRTLVDAIAKGSIADIWDVFDKHMTEALDAILASEALQGTAGGTR